MLVDEVTIRVEAGRGGRGAVAFNRVRLMFGPTGADGGSGGNVYAEGVSDINALAGYASVKVLHAEDGQHGRGQFVDGKRGEDAIIKTPIGTRITNLSTGHVQEIQKIGERILLAGGGVGGRGNFKFRSSTNTTPKQFEEGTAGDAVSYKFELLLIADVGLVGLPNAGKSSLLNELTAAKSKVGSYAFTTLEPHLGSYYGLLIADIPGLIEGASAGKGLGVKFLKHVERTKTLFHLVSAESDDVSRDYSVVRKELEAYNPELASKTEYVLLTKCDAISLEEREAMLKTLRGLNPSALAISILEPETLQEVKKILNTIKDAR